MRITFLSFLYGLVQLGRFNFSSKAAFNGKRPIFPFWDSEEKEIPSGFFEVLMTFDGKNFTSADGLLKIAIPTEEEESVHDFKTLNDEEDCSQFYLLFTAQELQDAGYNTTRSPGFNYWNPEAVRWEPRGHVLENSWADHRFYVVPDGYIAVCYRLNEDGDVRSENPNLPVFTKDNIETAGCFQHNLRQSTNQVKILAGIQFPKVGCHFALLRMKMESYANLENLLFPGNHLCRIGC